MFVIKILNVKSPTDEGSVVGPKAHNQHKNAQSPQSVPVAFQNVHVDLSPHLTLKVFQIKQTIMKRT